jgi:uncharacterized membrane-anchored protein YhcB (DUF1043 family)
MNLTTIVLDLIGIVTIIGGSILALISRLPKETIINQKALIESYEKRFADIEHQQSEDLKHHTEERLVNAKAIADLQGQIKVYKELPLQEMALAMQDISRVNKVIADSNREILLTLRSSAIIAADDRSTLLNPTQNITKQTVETQVIKNQE